MLIQWWSVARGETSLYLKHLEIAGFKSFGRSTEFDFRAGVSALVGPNGSGKSNVVDAIRWCLGEQSMRDLRSQKSEDVIYAGPERTHGAAEVILTFEATGDDDFSWSEMTVARRLYRSGESEYLLDGENVRLRDIVSTLRGLRVHGLRNIIVNQGMADSLLAASPHDRRLLLEQAAGLSAYRERRDDANHKLETTRQNVETIGTVLNEIEPRLKLLQRQARAVVDRDEARARLDQALRSWYAASWADSRERLSVEEGEVDVAAVSRSTLSEQVRKLEDQAERAIERERSWHQRSEAATAGLHATQRERDNLNHAIERVNNLDQRAHDSLREAEKALRELKVDNSQRLLDLQINRQGLTEVRENLASLRSQHLHLEDVVSDAEETYAMLASEEQKAGEEWVRTLQKAQELERLAHAETVHAAHLSERLETSRSWLAQNAALTEGLVQSEQGQSAGWETSERRLADITNSLTQAEIQLEKTEQRLQRFLRVRNKSALLSTSALDAQSQVERALETEIIDLSGSITVGLTVAAGWEMAAAVALGPWKFVGSRPVEELRLHPFREDTLERLKDSICREITHPLIWADEVVVGLPTETFHPLSSTIFSDDDEIAQSLWNAIARLPVPTIGTPAIQVASRGGKCWNCYGVRTVDQHDAANRLFRLRSELARRNRWTFASTRRTAKLQESVEGQELVRSQALTRRDTLRLDHSSALTARANLEARLIRLRREIYERKEEVTGRQCEYDELMQTADAAESLAKSLNATVNELRASVEKQNAVRKEVQTALGRQAAVLDGARAKLAEIKRNQQTAETKLEAQARTVTGLESDLSRYPSEELRLGRLVDAAREQIAGIHEELEQRSNSLAQLDRVLANQVGQLEAIRATAPNHEVAISVLREARARHAESIALHERALASRDALRAKQNELRRVIEEELRAAPEFLGRRPEESPTEDEIKRLRARAAQYPDAELSVITEYDELAERKRYLASHVEDLQLAMDNLRSIMTVADREMEERFQGAFDAVSAEFSRVFQVMLRGGDASIEENPDGRGIEIRARLPGRRNRSSAAFSGGERALVASSLLFAILKIRPTPFIVLDEVDAALDENNVDRFIRVLHDVSRTTQILIVTHNRATMAAAGALYGINMDENGISSVLSLRLEAYGAAG